MVGTVWPVRRAQSWTLYTGKNESGQRLDSVAWRLSERVGLRVYPGSKLSNQAGAAANVVLALPSRPKPAPTLQDTEAGRFATFWRAARKS